MVITDGEENSSHEFTREMVFDLINEKRTQSWEFVFMGAGVDAYAAGAALGVPSTSTHQYGANPVGQRQAFAHLSSSSTAYRSGVASAMLMPDQPERKAKKR